MRNPARYSSTPVAFILRSASFAAIEYPSSAAAGQVANSGPLSSISPLGLGMLNNDRVNFSVAVQPRHAFGPVGISNSQRATHSIRISPSSQMCPAISFGFARTTKKPTIQAPGVTESG